MHKAHAEYLAAHLKEMLVAEARPKQTLLQLFAGTNRELALCTSLQLSAVPLTDKVPQRGEDTGQWGIQIMYLKREADELDIIDLITPAAEKLQAQYKGNGNEVDWQGHGIVRNEIVLKPIDIKVGVGRHGSILTER